MAGTWSIAAFPLILPWQPEFWTLPLYFPDLKVGVKHQWPESVPYEGLPLPPEARRPLADLKHYAPGEARQWHAFQEFQQSREEVDDLVRALRGEPEEPAPETREFPEAWAMAWQLEQMQAEQDARMSLVDRGNEWLADIFRPEPWEDKSGFGQAPGLKETMDPELARIRYGLWRRVMGEALTGAWAPLLLGRGSAAVLAALLGWPQWTFVERVTVKLPGVQSEPQWREAQNLLHSGPWQEQFATLLNACLEAAAGRQDLSPVAGALAQFGEALGQAWPQPPSWWWSLEIWSRPDQSDWEWGPVLNGAPDGTDILPG